MDNQDIEFQFYNPFQKSLDDKLYFIPDSEQIKKFDPDSLFELSPIRIMLKTFYNLEKDSIIREFRKTFKEFVFGVIYTPRTLASLNDITKDIQDENVREKVHDICILIDGCDIYQDPVSSGLMGHMEDLESCLPESFVNDKTVIFDLKENASSSIDDMVFEYLYSKSKSVRSLYQYNDDELEYGYKNENENLLDLDDKSTLEDIKSISNNNFDLKKISSSKNIKNITKNISVSENIPKILHLLYNERLDQDSAKLILEYVFPQHFMERTSLLELYGKKYNVFVNIIPQGTEIKIGKITDKKDSFIAFIPSSLYGAYFFNY